MKRRSHRLAACGPQSEGRVCSVFRVDREGLFEPALGAPAWDAGNGKVTAQSGGTECGMWRVGLDGRQL